MTTRYAVFLRGISNVPMLPYREALERLDFNEVASFGTSGNLFFSAPEVAPQELAARIEEAVGTEAFVLERGQLAEVVAGDPFRGREGAAVFLTSEPIGEADILQVLVEGFEGEPPRFAGRAAYFVHPLRRPGRKAILDWERALGVRGTMRSSAVLARVLELMG